MIRTAWEKAWHRQELISGWRELQEYTPAGSGRELHHQGHEIPWEDLLPQCSTSSSVQEQSQGTGSLAQTYSDNIPKILFQQFAVRSFLHHRCCFQSGLSKIGFMPLFYPSLKAISTLSFSKDKNIYINVHWKLLFKWSLLWVMLDLPHCLWSTYASSSCTLRSILIHILISKYW